MRAEEQRSRAHYERVARWYDWRNNLAAWARRTSPARERRQAIDHLRLAPGHRVLEVAVGTGTNLPLIADACPDVRLVGLDITRLMLRVCQDKARKHGLAPELVEGSALDLPFAGGSFDAVFHHGGIAEFPDRRIAIAEMFRVARSGGLVVICDAGIPEDGRLGLINGLLLLLQPEYRQHPPMDLLPSEARDVRLSWYFRGGWYLIEARKA